MPSRIIRESALTSRSLDLLSDGAERMFWRLTIVADDHGRFDANPQVLKAKCFPLKVDTLKSQAVTRWLSELEQARSVGLYQIEGREYGVLLNWFKYQRPRASKSKFPDPPADCGKLPQNAAPCGQTPPYPREEIRDKGEEISEPRGGAPRKQSYPLGFEVSTEVSEWAAREGLPDPNTLLDAFRDYHVAHASRFLDWNAALRTWVRNAKRFGNGKGNGVSDKETAMREKTARILRQGL